MYFATSPIRTLVNQRDSIRSPVSMGTCRPSYTDDKIALYAGKFPLVCLCRRAFSAVTIAIPSGSHIWGPGALNPFLSQGFAKFSGTELHQALAVSINFSVGTILCISPWSNACCEVKFVWLSSISVPRLIPSIRGILWVPPPRIDSP